MKYFENQQKFSKYYCELIMNFYYLFGNNMRIYQFSQYISQKLNKSEILSNFILFDLPNLQCTFKSVTTIININITQRDTDSSNCVSK